MQHTDRTTAVAAAFTAIAEHRAGGGYAPIYARLAAACATDPDMLDIASLARRGQNPPSLLLGAVQYLLASYPDHPLVRFYPALTGHSAPDLAAEDPWPHLRAFVADHHDEVTGIIATRLVQTHEVGRSTYLYPALLAAQRHAGAPLAVIEIGPSAGLTLVPDRYAYTYGTGPVYGDTSSPLTLACELRGPHRPPLNQALNLAWRAGIDLNPLDLADPADRAWLRTLIWPDHPDRVTRLDAAFTAAQRGPLPDIYQGGVTELLPTLLNQAPPGVVVCVYHTAVTAHFTPNARDAHSHQLHELSTQRRVIWLRAEPGEEPRLRFTDLVGGRAAAEVVLGHYHPHGAWLHWLRRN